MIKVQVKPDDEVGENFYCFYGKPRDAGQRYYPGDRFEIHDVSAFSAKYMNCLDPNYEVVEILDEEGNLVGQKLEAKRKKPGPKPKEAAE